MFEQVNKTSENQGSEFYNNMQKYIYGRWSRSATSEGVKQAKILAGSPMTCW